MKLTYTQAIEKRPTLSNRLILGTAILTISVLSTLLPATSHAADNLRVHDCAGPLHEKVVSAFRYFLNTARDDRDKLVKLMDDAYLVEHDGRSPSDIVSLLTRAKVTTIRCRNLDEANASAHRVYLKRGVMRVDRTFIRNSSIKRIASVMAHETMHNNGLNHQANDIGSRYYGNTVPEQIEAAYLRGKPNPWPGPGKDHYVATDMMGFGTDGSNNWNFAWSKDGTVTAGSTSRIHAYRIPYRYSLPAGYAPSDIVGMGVDGESNWTFAWYRNGYVSAGTSNDLDKYRKPYRFSLPAGYSPADVVGMGIDGENNWIFVWYRNGYVSAGTSDDLDKHRKPYRFSLPAGYSPADIVGMGIDGENNWIFAWYRNGYVSAGTSNDLDKYRKPYRVDTGR